MPTKYLIDVENIGDKWAPYIAQLQEDDTIVLFYTKASNGRELTIPIDSLHSVCEKRAKMEYIQCFTGAPGHNALDFQLATELGAQLVTHKDTNYIIISRDTGFDVLVKYWQHKGFNIIRTDPSHIVSTLNNNAVATKQCRGYYESVCVANGVPGQYLHTVVNIMIEGMLRPESDRLLYIRNQILRQVKPKRLADRTYNKLKNDLHRIKYEGPFPATEDKPSSKKKKLKEG